MTTKTKPEKSAAKPEKTKGPKKPRDTVAVRKYKDSPAGHFGDVIRSMMHKLGKTAKKTAKWTGVEAALFVTAAAALKALAEPFDALALTNFKPKRGGISATFTGNEIVTLTADCIKLLNRDFADLTAEHEVTVVPTYQAGDKQVPLQSGGQFLGRINYKFITGTGQIAATEEPAAETVEGDDGEETAEAAE